MMKKTEITNTFQKHTNSCLVLTLFVLFHCSLNIAAAENNPVTVKDLLELPQSYQLHTVTLRGTVTNVQKVPPKSMNYCINRYTFTLTDETGSIPVYVEGICANRIPLPPEVTEMDIVFVEGNVQAIDPGKIPQPPNNKIIGGEQGVRIIARKIWR